MSVQDSNTAEVKQSFLYQIDVNYSILSVWRLLFTSLYWFLAQFEQIDNRSLYIQEVFFSLQMKSKANKTKNNAVFIIKHIWHKRKGNWMFSWVKNIYLTSASCVEQKKLKGTQSLFYYDDLTFTGLWTLFPK